MSWFNRKTPYTGTGQPKPKERSLPPKIKPVFLNREGKKIGPKKPKRGK